MRLGLLSVSSGLPALLALFGAAHAALGIEDEPPPPPQLPASWPRCVHTDPDFDHCLRDAVQATLPQLAYGAPELDVPPLEPLTLPGELVLNEKPSRARIKLALSNVRAHGLSRTHVLSVFSDLKLGVIDVHAMMPLEMIEADFRAEGQILRDQINSHGRVNLTLHGAEIFFGLEGAVQEHSNKERYLSIKAARVDFVTLGGLHARFEPLDPDPHRNEVLNSLVDSQSKAMWSVMRSGVQRAFAAVFQHLASAVFSKVPLKDVFLDSEHPSVRNWQNQLLQAEEPLFGLQEAQNLFDSQRRRRHSPTPRLALSPPPLQRYTAAAAGTSTARQVFQADTAATTTTSAARQRYQAGATPTNAVSNARQRFSADARDTSSEVVSATR